MMTLDSYIQVVLPPSSIRRQGHVQATQGAARLDAKRARVELVQGQALGGLINLRLSGGRALFFAGAGQEIASDNQLTQAYAERFDKHSNSLIGKKEGPQLT